MDNTFLIYRFWMRRSKKSAISKSKILKTKQLKMLESSVYILQGRL